MLNKSNQAVRQVKKSSLRLCARAAELGHPLSQGQALELVAAYHGHKTWHAYRAALLRNDVAAEAPASVGVSTFHELTMFRCYSVALYVSTEAEGQTFLGKELIFAHSLADAEETVATRHWDSRFDTVGSRVFYSAVAAEVLAQESSQVSKWLKQLGYSEDAFDDLVHDRAQTANLPTLSSTPDADAQDDEITEAEQDASTINNAGMDAQLEFLRKQHGGSTLEFMNWLAEELGIAEHF